MIQEKITKKCSNEIKKEKIGVFVLKESCLWLQTDTSMPRNSYSSLLTIYRGLAFYFTG